MSLLSINITKLKKLSLSEVKLPIPERIVEPITPILVERPPTTEEIAYSNLVAINPLVEELISRLALVSSSTGERIRKVELMEESKLPPELEKKPQDIDKPKLIALAQRVIKGENSYKKEEIIELIKIETQVTQERAERGFTLLLQAGVIEPTLGDGYYLTGSTPF